MKCATHGLVAAFAAAWLAGSSQAQSTTRISVDSAGTEADGGSGVPAFSRDGRFVVYWSDATNLVPNDTNGRRDIFVRDLVNGTTERESVDSTGVEGNNDSNDPCISDDGRFVAFYSFASNLVPGGTNPSYWCVYVRDRQLGTTELISVDSYGVQANSHSRYPSISGDGRYVAFSSNATNLVQNDTNGQYDVFLRDRLNATTDRISVDSNGNQGDLQSIYPSISSDGRYVVFESTATNLVPGDTNGVRDILLRDLLNATTTRISVDSSGAQSNGASFWPQISADGRFVAYHSSATNLVAGDTNAVSDVFVYDLANATTERVSVDSSGVQGNQQSLNATISADGRFVSFESAASNLVGGDVNAVRDIFVRDRQGATTQLVSIDSNGAQTDALSQWCAISGDGRFVAFQSSATNLVGGDTNGLPDIFLHDRGAPPPGTDICQPGVGAVMACPCGNPPANAPRGCDNSAGTGGAQLVSSGTASLASDTVVFVTNGEKPTATSILLQGTLEVTAGVAFGQGVRCVGGALKRMFVKSASGGSITAPGPGDPTISQRAAILNQPIAPGNSRWYGVYYRDPIVLGGCAGTNTFNITQTQVILWGP